MVSNLALHSSWKGLTCITLTCPQDHWCCWIQAVDGFWMTEMHPSWPYSLLNRDGVPWLNWTQFIHGLRSLIHILVADSQQVRDCKQISNMKAWKVQRRSETYCQILNLCKNNKKQTNYFLKLLRMRSRVGFIFSFCRISRGLPSKLRGTMARSLALKPAP